MSASKSSTTANGPRFDGFTDEERAAMKDHARELKATARRSPRTARADGEADVLAKIAEMKETDRVLGERVHTVVMDAVADLVPKLWYGMPAYTRDGKIVCYFQSAEKFKARYATLGFSDVANLDDGTMWPTAFALTKELTAADERTIRELVKQAAS